ncbi:MAG: hypothetical protein KTQ49_00920 [Candidatus Omnitrophica bacterium]|nr:hypothetical protein [Candidatus Omnitrophota bacterium]
MNQHVKWTILFMILGAFLNLGARSSDQYDQEARLEEEAQKQLEQQTPYEAPHHPVKNFAAGIKEITVDNAKDALSDTAEGTAHEKPLVGTLDGAQRGGAKVVDNTIKGVKKVVSLGYAKDDSYSIEEPVDRSGDAAKIKLFKF